MNDGEFLVIALVVGLVITTVVAALGFFLGALIFRDNPTAGGVGGAVIACGIGGSVFFGPPGMFIWGVLGAIEGLVFLAAGSSENKDAQP